MYGAFELECSGKQKFDCMHISDLLPSAAPPSIVVTAGRRATTSLVHTGCGAKREWSESKSTQANRSKPKACKRSVIVVQNRTMGPHICALCESPWPWVQARVASLLYVTTMWILVYVESMPMLVCVVMLWRQRGTETTTPRPRQCDATQADSQTRRVDLKICQVRHAKCLRVACSGCIGRCFSSFLLFGFSVCFFDCGRSLSSKV